MKSFFTIFLCAVFRLVGPIDALPTNDTRLTNYNATFVSNASFDLQAVSINADETPWQHYNGHATAEIWIGRSAVNVGDLTQAGLYGAVWGKIDQICPSTKPGYCYSSDKHAFATHYVTKASLWPIEYGDTYFYMLIDDFRWHYEETRRLLIGAAAGTLEALTKAGSPNCYALPLHGKHFCNIGDRVYINLPDQDGRNNYLHLRFFGDQVFNYFRCCRDDKVHDQNVRRDVDQAIDGLGPELSAEFGQPFTRLTMCVLKGWRICEECGEDCDGCGTSCPHS